MTLEFSSLAHTLTTEQTAAHYQINCTALLPGQVCVLVVTRNGRRLTAARERTARECVRVLRRTIANLRHGGMLPAFEQYR